MGDDNTPTLDCFFRPRSVAVIGASRDPQKLGYTILDNLLKHRYPGRIYPVNPQAQEIFHLKVYPTVTQIPDPVDMAVIVVPAPVVPFVLQECGMKGVKGVVIISAGFRETGAEGLQREKELVAMARRYGIRIVGPNCLGVINTFHSLNATFAEGMPNPWEVGLMSQSGAMATAILDWANLADVGFSKFISMGNMADVDEVDLLEYWKDDEECKVIVGYLESIDRGQRFLEVARQLTARKPLVLMKVGRTAAGAAAASSHTGALSTPDQVIEAAFQQAGITRAETMEQLFDFTMCFSWAPLPKGERMAVITNAGGPGVMTTDAIENSGLHMAQLGPQTLTTLGEHLPQSASTHNPIDLLGDALADRYLAALEAVLRDPGVDGVFVLLTPQAVTEPERTARVITSHVRSFDKPVMAVYMGGVAVGRGTDMLEEARVPVYAYPERAVRAMAALVEYGRYLESA